RAGAVTDCLRSVACAVTDGRAGFLDRMAGFGGGRCFLAGESRSGQEKSAEQQQKDAHFQTVSRRLFGRNSPAGLGSPDYGAVPGIGWSRALVSLGREAQHNRKEAFALARVLRRQELHRRAK